MVSRRALVLLMGGTAAAGAGAAAIWPREAPEPPAPPAMDAQGHTVWRNWSGIQMAYPQARAAPANEDELADLLRKSPGPLRCVGAGHSFMPLVPTPGTLITLDRFDGITAHDPVALTATVRAGTRLSTLGRALAAIGQDMPNLPDINKQSLAGAISTATHGTGEALHAIHGNITGFRLVTADGKITDCDAVRTPELFAAAKVGLGAFGVITSVTLRNAPMRRVERLVRLMPVEDTMHNWPALKAQNRNVEFYYLPFTGTTAVITHNETDQPATPRAPSVDNDTLLDLKHLRDWLGWSPNLRRTVARRILQTVPPERVVGEAWQLLSNERSIRFNEMEFHLPAEVQMAALREIITAIEINRPDVFFPIEARAIAEDDAWLSPFYQRASGSIAVHAYYKEDYKSLFAMIEPILRRYGGRPHWGKLNHLSKIDFASLYPRFAEAAAVRKSVDPEGRFLNDYLQRVFVS